MPAAQADTAHGSRNPAMFGDLFRRRSSQRIADVRLVARRRPSVWSSTVFSSCMAPVRTTASEPKITLAATLGRSRSRRHAHPPPHGTRHDSPVALLPVSARPAADRMAALRTPARGSRKPRTERVSFGFTREDWQLQASNRQKRTFSFLGAST
jgi:hypothetical protein